MVRTSNTVVTITLPAFQAYDVTATETITTTVPASALVASAVPVVAAPTFDVTVTAGSVALAGTIVGDNEIDVRAGGATLTFTLADDSWIAAGAAFDAERQNIINGLVSAQSEANGWNNVVQAGLAVTDVVRTSNTVVTITLPAFVAYDITAVETITATLPASALAQSGAALVAAPTLDIVPVAASISSAVSQIFTVGDPTTAIAIITITDDPATATITAANDLRVRIPAGFNMLWDVADLTAVLGGAVGKVTTAVTYEDGGRTLVLNVTAEFVAGEQLTVSGLSFTSFAAMARNSSEGV